MSDSTTPPTASPEPTDAPTAADSPEPTDFAAATDSPAAAEGDLAPTPVVAPPPPAYDAPSRPRAAEPGSPRRRRLALGGAAAGLVVAGALGGFTLGHATAGDGRGDRFEQSSFRGDGDGDFGHHGERGPRFGGPGQPPGFGQGPTQQDSTPRGDDGSST